MDSIHDNVETKDLIEEIRQVREKAKEEARQAREKAKEEARQAREKAKEEVRQAREKEILELIRSGKSQKEIAQIMKVLESTISVRISKIDSQEIKKAKEEARQKMEKAKEEVRQAREKEILELIRAGKTQQEIATIIGKSQSRINYRISEMDYKKVQKARQEGRVKRKALREELNNEKRKQEYDEIRRLQQAGKTQTEIARMLGKSKATISDRISRMNARDPDGMQEIQQQIEEEKNEKEKQRNERILELLREGKIQINIAEIMGFTNAAINKWINKIDSKKVDEAKKQGEARILELKRAGKTVEEIAEIVGTSQFAIIRRINKMSAMQEENKKEIDEIKPNYAQLKQKLKEHTITRDEIDAYRDYLDDKYDKIDIKEVLLMSNMYIKTKRTDEAIAFLNILIRNEDMEYLGKEKLIEARSETERIGKIQRVRELVKNNRSISEIMVETGLKEIEVIRIRNEIQGDREI